MSFQEKGKCAEKSNTPAPTTYSIPSYRKRREDENAEKSLDKLETEFSDINADAATRGSEIPGNLFEIELFIAQN